MRNFWVKAVLQQKTVHPPWKTAHPPRKTAHPPWKTVHLPICDGKHYDTDTDWTLYVNTDTDSDSLSLHTHNKLTVNSAKHLKLSLGRAQGVMHVGGGEWGSFRRGNSEWVFWRSLSRGHREVVIQGVNIWVLFRWSLGGHPRCHGGSFEGSLGRWSFRGVVWCKFFFGGDCMLPVPKQYNLKSSFG